MLKLKKIISMALVASFLLTTLVACGNTKKGDASSGTPSGVVSNNKPTKELSGKVVYWSMWNESEPQAQAIKKAVELFNKDYPDCKVEIQWLGRSNSQVVPPAIQGNEKIDIIDNLPYTADPTMFLDITSMMKEPAIGQPDKTVEESILHVLNVANKENQVSAGLTGEHYGVPMSPWTVSFFYNKDLFAKAGIEKLPTTWTEFLEVCKTLKSSGINALTTDDAYMTLIPNGYLARLVDKDGIAKLSASAKDELWKSEAVSQTYNAMEELSNYYSSNVKTNKYPAGQQEFALGEAAMYLNASWFPGEVYNTAGDEFPWGAFNFPTVEGGKQDASTISLGAIPMSVVSKSDNKEAAMEFLKYCVAKEVQDSLSKDGQVAPCTVGSEWPGAVKECGAQVESAKFVAPLAQGLSSDFVNAVFSAQVNKIITKSATAKDAYATLLKEINKY